MGKRKPLKPLHRDDLPADLAAGIVELLKAKHPGMRVCFAGDGSLPPKVEEVGRQMIAALGRAADRSLAEGRCMDCGKQMPGRWPRRRLAKGWACFTDMDDTPSHLLCPKCDGEMPTLPPA